MQKKTLEEKFWNKVCKDGPTPKNKPCKGNCWVWNGASQTGYGSQLHDGKRLMAHRISFELDTNKPIPYDMMVLHKCDNRACVRPGHLYLGTAKDNMIDTAKRSRKAPARSFTKSKTVEEFFYKRIEITHDGCWNWTGATSHGYGSFVRDGKSYKAHRWSYEHNFKIRIPPNMVIMHLCDNKKCVNPNHLSCATQKENIIDYLNKVKKPKVKLSKKDLLLIISEYKNGTSAAELARRFGIDKSYACDIINGKAWKNLDLPTIENLGSLKQKHIANRRKLSDKEVFAVRRLYQNGAIASKLAKQFSVSITTIMLIIHGKTYKHLNLNPIQPHAKMDAQDIIKMRKLYSTNKYTQIELANMFSVSFKYVNKIVNKKIWKNL